MKLPTHLSLLGLLIGGANFAQCDPTFSRIKVAGVHNSFQVTEKVISGSQPEGDAAFAALARLGVRTILSVDGSVPDVAAAGRHGLKYVHLPFGYDGIPANRVAALAKLATEVSGPIFVHCHHGLHRGPAAVAVMCEALAGWTPARAEAWMREAGTAAEYRGLYRTAREFKPPSPAELASVNGLPEVTKPSSLVEAMVTIDEHFSWLKQCQKAGWKTPPGHADIVPTHEAMMLWEQFREMVRADDAKNRLQDYRAKLTDAERAADALRGALKSSSDATAFDAAFKQVTQACAACHKKYRN